LNRHSRGSFLPQPEQRHRLAAEHSIHWTGGIRLHFEHFSDFEFFLLPNIVHACRAAPALLRHGEIGADIEYSLENSIKIIS